MGDHYVFAGQATIVDGDGSVLAHQEGDEDVVATKVCLDSTLTHQSAPPAYGWYLPRPAGRELPDSSSCGLDITTGETAACRGSRSSGVGCRGMTA